MQPPSGTPFECRTSFTIWPLMGVYMLYVSEQFNHRVWIAFGRLIEKRYRRSIRFSPAMNALDLGREFIINKAGDLMIPLMFKGYFLGCISVRQGGSLEAQSMREIQDIVNKIGTVLLDSGASIEKEREIENLLVEHKKHLISLVGGSLEERKKVASYVQDTLESWSLLSWADAGMANWNTDEMNLLSDVCIFIRDLNELSSTEKDQLMTLVRLPESMRPHLILGSDKPLTTEKSLPEGAVLSDSNSALSTETGLASLFASSPIVLVDQLPQESERLKEVLEMLLVGTKHLQLDGKSLV